MMYASSPTDKCSMDLLEGKLDSLIGSAEISQEVKIKDIEKAFWKLNKNKDDGKYETNSNHFVYASARFMCIFSLLLRCMLVHGHSPEELRKSVITSIPKDPRGEINNYR